MKRALSIFFCLALCLALFAAPPWSRIARNLPAAGGGGSGPTPILRWKMNEGSGTTVADSSGNGYNGTLSGSPLPAWVAHGSGISTPGAGAAYSISCEANYDGGAQDGTGIVIGSAALTQLGGTQHASITCWIYQTVPWDNSVVGLNLDLTGQHLFSLNYSVDDQAYLVVANGSTAARTFPTYNANNWYFVCMTYDGTVATAANRVVGYTNGVVAAQDGGSGTIPSSLPTAAQLGYPSVSGPVAQSFGGPYYGGYCDLQIFAVTLTQAQITALYTAGPDN